MAEINTNTSITEIKEKAQRVFNIFKNFNGADNHLYVLLLFVLDRKGALEQEAINDFLESKIMPDQWLEKCHINSIVSSTFSEFITPNNSLFTSYVFARQLYEIGEEKRLEFFESIGGKVPELFENFPKYKKEEIPALFEEYLEILTRYEGRKSGEYYQPKELTKLMCSLANLPENASVYNPFAGIASFGVEFKNVEKYVAQDINERTRIIGLLRLMVHDLEDKSNYLLGDSINHWNPTEEEFDVIIANPPINISKAKNELSLSEWLLLGESAVDTLKSNGKRIYVLPQQFHYSLSSDIRKQFWDIDQHATDIEMIISLPSGILRNSNIELSIVVLNSVYTGDGSIKFVNGSDCFVPTDEGRLLDYELIISRIQNNDNENVRIVPLEEIVNADYNLNPKRYLLKEIDGISLTEFVTIQTGEYAGKSEIGKVIRNRNLKNDLIDFSLDLNDVETTEIPAYAQLTKGPALLISDTGTSLKPTYISNDDYFYITPKVLALEIDQDKVNREYLINELHQQYVKEQFSAFQIGASMPTIKKDDLLNIKIKIPEYFNSSKSILLQEEKASEIKRTLGEERIRNLSKIHGLEDELHEQNSYLRHKLVGPIQNLRLFIGDLEKIYRELAKKYPEIEQVKFDSQGYSFDLILQKTKRDIQKISKVVSKKLKSDLNLDNYELDIIDLVKFIDNYTIEKKVIDFSKDPELDSLETLNITANEDLLHELFDNLLENAKKYGIRNQKNGRVEIYITRPGDTYKSELITIQFSNTGTPFPKHITLAEAIKKGFTTDPSNGDGYGLYLVDKIVKRFHGILNLTRHESEIVTTFEMTFPLLK